jgi:hypothetical protein
MSETLNEPIPRPAPELEEDLNVAKTWEFYQQIKPERDWVYAMWCLSNGIDPDDPSSAYRYEMELVADMAGNKARRWRREGYLP